MQNLSSFDLSHPVLVGTRESGLFVISGEVEGSCFAVGESRFLTAGHVVKALQALPPGKTGAVGLFTATGDAFALDVLDSEVLPGDVGVLATIKPPPPVSGSWFALAWALEKASAFDVVRTVGYPYGLNRVDDALSLVPRSFQGHVVADVHLFKPSGYEGSPFPVYETSFGAPRGLSGAPLLTGHGAIQVCGIIIGNSQSRMLILESEDVDHRNGSTSVSQTFESLTLGVAAQTRFMASLESRILGGKVGDHFPVPGRGA